MRYPPCSRLPFISRVSAEVEEISSLGLRRLKRNVALPILNILLLPRPLPRPPPPTVTIIKATIMTEHPVKIENKMPGRRSQNGSKCLKCVPL